MMWSLQALNVCTYVYALRVYTQFIHLDPNICEIRLNVFWLLTYPLKCSIYLYNIICEIKLQSIQVLIYLYESIIFISSPSYQLRLTPKGIRWCHVRTYVARSIYVLQLNIHIISQTFWIPNISIKTCYLYSHRTTNSAWCDELIGPYIYTYVYTVYTKCQLLDGHSPSTS